MKGSDPSKKKSYSLVYRIYRRIRYLRRIHRTRKLQLSDNARQEKLDRRRQKEDLREHVRQLKQDERLKLRIERDRLKKEQAEVRERLREQSSLTSQLRKDEEEIEKKNRQAEKALQRKQRRRLRRQSIRFALKSLFWSIRNFSLKAMLMGVKARKDSILKFTIIFFNSFVLYLLAYFAIYLLAQTSTVLAGKLFHYPSKVYYWEIYFNISVTEWYHDSVKTIYSAGPIISLLTGIALMIVYISRKESTGLFKLFFLWGFLHGVSMFFGAMLVGTLFEKGIGHVISWMYVMDTGKVLYSIISLFMLAIAGLVSVKPFLISGNTYYNDMTRRNRRPFMWAQAILPFIAGSIFLVLIRQPRFMMYETFVTLSLAIPLFIMMGGLAAQSDLYFDEDRKYIRVDWRYLLLLVVILLFYRGVLNFGIPVP